MKYNYKIINCNYKKYFVRLCTYLHIIQIHTQYAKGNVKIIFKLMTSGNYSDIMCSQDIRNCLINTDSDLYPVSGTSVPHHSSISQYNMINILGYHN